MKRLALLLEAIHRESLSRIALLVGQERGRSSDDICTQLERFCPVLEELILLIRRGPLGATIDDLYEVHEAKATIYNDT